MYGFFRVYDTTMISGDFWAVISQHAFDFHIGLCNMWNVFAGTPEFIRETAPPDRGNIQLTTSRGYSNLYYVEQVRHYRILYLLGFISKYNIDRTSESFTSSLLHLHKFASVIQVISLVALFISQLRPGNVPQSYEPMPVNHGSPRLGSTTSLPYSTRISN
ncbi:uncharacterized protein BJ212DRAFT_1299521 [Suillus subaureus]|uniref:Uncharacterized protein n=1 Tax=Suillus subaureus TaxID=48587 RepID=A0A9P7EBD7_9AGAM|nr:uncharacterized protein BJ212DRAFT_1299521 [Suillus subaureus]KAG1816772.1 hypothetical protein BJ212DRAFT_1299521 [Suillus subaureus]